LLEALGEVRGIESGRQRHHADIEALGRSKLHPAQRGGLTGRVSVEAQPQA
jgi:hypothetical protein